MINAKRKLRIVGLVTLGVITGLAVGEPFRLKRRVEQAMRTEYNRFYPSSFDSGLIQWKWGFIFEHPPCDCGNEFNVGLYVNGKHPMLKSYEFFTWTTSPECKVDMGDPAGMPRDARTTNAPK